VAVFGDIDEDDLIDPSEPDAGAVARIFWNFLRQQNPSRWREFEKHTIEEKAAIVAAFVYLLSRLERERGL
jgi:hypothetical protein